MSIMDVRFEAKIKGDKFFLGHSCKRGHSGKRYVSTGGCVECLTVGAKPKPPLTSAQAMMYQRYKFEIRLDRSMTQTQVDTLDAYLLECAYRWAVAQKMPLASQHLAYGRIGVMNDTGKSLRELHAVTPYNV